MLYFPYHEIKTFLFFLTFIYFYLLLSTFSSSCCPAKVPQTKCTVRFRPDRLGLKFTCVTPDDFQSGNYELIYDANGVTQAAGGTILPNNPQTYEVLFGSCSGAVCTFHENIQNARLSIKSTLKNGTRILKPYRLNI
jgi:hypothetical protein